MLIHDLQKNTPQTHPDYAALQDALVKMKQFADNINERKRAHDRVFQIKDNIVGFKVCCLLVSCSELGFSWLVGLLGYCRYVSAQVPVTMLGLELLFAVFCVAIAVIEFWRFTILLGLRFWK